VGVNLRELIPDKARHTVEDLRSLRGKVIVIDGYNALYQFLAAIRQPDGTPLMDTRGRVTSHELRVNEPAPEENVFLSP
jgi:flap endonuclease-1